MKILYIGRERSDAQTVATALRGLDTDVRVSWASHLEHALRWLDENPDLAALIAEAQIDGGGRWPSVLKHVRGLAIHPAVVVIVPDGTGPPFDALQLEADDYICRNQSLCRDLPVVVTRAAGRAARTDLEQKLAQATAALQEAEQRHRVAIAAADRQLAERQAKYEISVARAAATWEMVDEQFRAAAIEVERARQHHASAAADVDRLSRREVELSSQLADAAARRHALERRLADADTAVEEATTRAEHERLAAAGQLAERQRELEAQIAQAVDQRRSVEGLLEQAVGALDDAEKRHASEMIHATSQSRELEAALRAARQDLESTAADLERLAIREADLNSRLADVITSRTDLERRLAATEASFEDTVTRATHERLVMSKRAAAREAELDGQIRRESATRVNLEQAVAKAETALRDAQRRHEAALATAATELAEHQAHFGRELTQAAAAVERLTRRETELGSQLTDAQTAHHTLERQLADASGAIRQAAAHAAELDHQIQRERATRDALEQAIADAEAALRDAHQRHNAALATAGTELAEHQAHFDRQLSLAAAERDRLIEQLSGADVSLKQARRDHESAAADLGRLTQREAELTLMLADVDAARHTLERQLADATSALRQAAAHAATLEEQIQQERGTHVALEQAIADAEAALRDAHQRHDAALATAATELAEHQAHFDRELSQTAADRDNLARQFSEAEASLEQVRRDYQSAAAGVEDLTQRNGELTSQLADVQSARHTLERQLAEASSAIGEAAAHKAELDEQIRQERATRDALEEKVAAAEVALRDAHQRHDAALATAATELAEHQAHFDGELSLAAAERDRLMKELTEAEVTLQQGRLDYQSVAADVERLTQREAELASQLADTQAARDTLERQLAAAADRHAELEARLEQEVATRNTVEHTLAETRSAALDTERSFRGQTDTLSARLLEQASEFELQFAHERLEHEGRLADMQKGHRTLALERDALQQSLATLQGQSEQLRERLAAGVEKLEASRAEAHRLFEHAGLAMFRCTRDGALIDANRACATLVGRRIDELRGAHFATAVFEAPNALLWLIERCLSTQGKEIVEATWRRNDGGRLFVRLSARSSGSDVVEIVAEDFTRVRVLEERLSQAHRLEAVGRLASEVAVTCGTMLSDIHQKGREWLMTLVNADSREHGGRLLDEVRRAAGLLQQVAACGDEEPTRTPMLVDLNTLVRDLEPVLKRVAGGDVEVQLQDISSPLNVDASPERVERLLVNLASYGRERMPFGGRLRIELGKIVVDRRFIAKHPNVRLGLHALITVTEIRRGAQTGELKPRGGTIGHGSHGRAAQRPGVDFGTLQRLVSECGGHLWMNIQPPGEMVAKIRLPLSSPHDQTLARTLVARVRERAPARWLHS